jgi:hypothetical protein
LNRRHFIEGALGTGLFAAWQTKQGAAASPALAPIPGADPSGVQDSTEAFQKLIATLPAVNARLSIPPGKYRFEPSLEPIFQFKKTNGLVIEGEDAVLLFTGNTPAFFFDNCSGITVSGVTVDWPRPPFSQGIIQNVAGREFTVEVDSHFPVTGKEPINTVGEYDPDLRLPSRNGVDQYYGVKSVSLVAEQTLRIEMEHPIALQKGNTVVLRHPVYGANVFEMIQCHDVQFDGVTLHASPGMGILANSGSGFEFNKLRVLPTPGTDRFLSLNADAVHLSDCSGAISFSNCEFEGMGDDAINIKSTYYKIVSSTDSPSALRWKLDSDYLPKPGTLLEIVDPATQILQGHVRVLPRSDQQKDGIINVQLVEMDHTIRPEGLFACDTRNGATTIIHDCNFGGNRARAILVHNDARIYRNRFYGQSLPAILLSADASRWMEGPLIRDIEIYENRFEFNYYGNMEYRRGAITIDTEEDALALDMSPGRVYRNISIHDNRFTASCGYDIFAVRTSGLSIERNSFRNSAQMLDASHAKEAVFLNNVACSRIEGNKFEGGERMSVSNSEMPT